MNREPLRDSVILGALGFFGTLLGFLIVPKLFKFTARRLVTGFIGEVVMIVLTGLLTEKVVDLIDRDQ